MTKRVERTERKNEHVIAAEAVLKVIEESGVRDIRGQLVEPYCTWHKRLSNDLAKWAEWITRAKQREYKQALGPEPEAPGPGGVEDES